MQGDVLSPSNTLNESKENTELNDESLNLTSTEYSQFKQFNEHFNLGEEIFTWFRGNKGLSIHT
jgi:hypothetical protein